MPQRLFQLFIRERKSKALHRALLAMIREKISRKSEDLQEVMILYGTYSADSIEAIVDAINHLHKNVAKYEKV